MLEPVSPAVLKAIEIAVLNAMLEAFSSGILEFSSVVQFAPVAPYLARFGGAQN